jgi:hypothetical protein
VKAIIVLVHPIVDPNPFEANAAALKNAGTVICACCQKYVPHQEIPASEEDQQVWTLKVTLCGVLSRTRIVTSAGEELRTVSIDGAWAFDGNVLCIRSGDHHDVAVAGRNVITRFVVFDVRAPEESPLCSKVQGHIAFQLKSTDQEVTRGDQHGAAFVSRAGVDSGLHSDGVERRAITLRAEIPNVVNPRANILFVNRERSRVSGSGDIRAG